MTKPNVVFLDMDGVVCTTRACVAMGNVGAGFTYLDPIALMLVKRLCMENNAKIVMSSAWRQWYDKTAMEAILGAACPSLDRYIWPHFKDWRTSSFDFQNEASDTSDRGREIKRWIDEHETDFNNFVILDDMADMRPLQANLVRCDLHNGIGFEEFKAAERMLSETS